MIQEYIKNITLEKAKLEQQIKNLCFDFEMNNGVVIKDIDYTREQRTDECGRVIMSYSKCKIDASIDI